MLSLLSFLSLEVEPVNLYVLGAAVAVSYFALIFYASTQLPKALGRKKEASAGAADKRGGQ